MPVTAAEVEAHGAHSLDEQVAPFPAPGAGEWYTDEQVLASSTFMGQVCSCWESSSSVDRRAAEGPKVLHKAQLLGMLVSGARVAAGKLVWSRQHPIGLGFHTVAKQKDWVSGLISRLLPLVGEANAEPRLRASVDDQS